MLEFDHIALSVPNIAEAVASYREKFSQLEILHEDETWAFVQIGLLKIAFVLEALHPPHMAFRIDSREGLEAMASQAQAPIMLHRDGSESFYQEDSGGNVIEMIFYPSSP